MRTFGRPEKPLRFDDGAILEGCPPCGSHSRKDAKKRPARWQAMSGGYI